MYQLRDDGTAAWVPTPVPPGQQAALDAARIPADVNAAALAAELTATIDVLLAGIAALKVVADTPNATINASPAGYIKDVARETRRGLRATVALTRLAVRALESTDTGTP